MNKQEKQEEVTLLRDRFSKSQISVLADYKGLTVADMTKLRRELRKVKATARVTKNSLAKLVIKEVYKDDSPADVEKLANLLVGPSMLTFSETDIVGPAKILTKFAKENGKLQIKGAWFDGAFLDTKGVEELSNLPSREETLSKLLRLLSAPATQVVRLLQAPGSQMVRLLGAYKAKLESEGKS